MTPIIKRFTGEMIAEGDEALRDLVIKHKANLWEADLRGADLREADLRGADLWGANLRETDLRGADLREANLWGANLRETDLRGADLRGADLWGANLRGADLWEADLRGADLKEANLREANLREADLRGAIGIVPPVILTASWYGVSDDLCRELMRYDASNLPNGNELFQKWADGYGCTYNGTSYLRSANFQEMKSLWSSGPAKSALELMLMLFKEKQVKFDG
jgi:uncharacterized protein YjbI with pentapeptide repeats